MMNQRMVGGMQNYALVGERPLPMLDDLPSLPKAAPIRLVEHENEKNQERVLVPVMPYANEMQYGQPEES